MDSWNSVLHCCGRHPRGQVPGPWVHPYYLDFHGMTLQSVVKTPRHVHSALPEAKHQGLVCIMLWFALLGAIVPSVYQEK